MDTAKANLIRAAQNLRDNWEHNLSDAMAQLMDALGDAEQPRDKEQEAYFQRAKAENAEEGMLEFDNDAVVSVSEDGGAYVQAWSWVSDNSDN